jgi:hypothetical protein
MDLFCVWNKDAKRASFIDNAKNFFMQPNNRKFMAIKVLALAVLFATTSSFSGTWGGDSYRVYVNNKLVLEQFVHGQKTIPAIALDQRSPNDEVRVFYSHCGKVGHARNLAIRDKSDKVLKQWKFADITSASDAPMSCKASEIVNLQKDGGKLGLHYSAKEMPDWKMLAVISVGKDNVGQP